MENDKTEEIDALTESYNKANESFNQFLFLTFIPNSWQNTVDVFVDEGEFRLTLPIPEFLDKIENFCGRQERIKISLACNNLGIPFFYDREHKQIIELREASKPERLNVATIRSMGLENEANKNNSLDPAESMYRGLRSQLRDLIGNIMSNSGD